MSRVGFVGLGVMGAPMSGHLVSAGHAVSIWNRTASKCEPLRGLGAEVCGSIEELASRCAVVMTCVNRSEDVADCVRRMAPAAAYGSLFVDHSTIDPGVAIELGGELARHGLKFVDAPITGGSMGAQKGQLTIFCGGEPEDVDRAVPYLAAYAKRAERVGPLGAGQRMKLANQIAVAGALIGLCESLSFAKKAGLDLAQAKDMIGGGAAGSWAFDNYGPKILAEDWSPGFSIVNQRKDFGYCASAASELDAAIPMTLLVDRLLESLQNEGHGDWTTAALYRKMLDLGFED